MSGFDVTQSPENNACGQVLTIGSPASAPGPAWSNRHERTVWLRMAWDTAQLIVRGSVATLACCESCTQPARPAPGLE